MIATIPNKSPKRNGRKTDIVAAGRRKNATAEFSTSASGESFDASKIDPGPSAPADDGREHIHYDYAEPYYLPPLNIRRPLKNHSAAVFRGHLWL